MTHELFKTEADFKKKQLEQDMKEALEFWQCYAADYREIPRKYQALLEKKRELGLKPLNKLSVSDLKGYPKIAFLDIVEESEALAQIDLWAESGALRHMIDKIRAELTASYSYNTMKAWVLDSAWLISKKTS